jgi:Tfp pilus assembly major pilin PilA
MEVVCSSPLDAPEIVIFIGIVTISSKLLVKYQRGVVEKRRVFEGIKE